MRGVRIPQDLNGEDQFILGLSVPRLAVLLLGLLAAYTILHLSLPTPIGLPLAAVAALLGAVMAWIRPEGRSLLHWFVAALVFKLTPNGETPTVIDQSASRIASHGTQSNLPSRSLHLQVIPSTAQERPQLPPAAVFESFEDDVIELPDLAGQAAIDASEGQIDQAFPAPVYLGGPQILTFFSTKGGTGRTTLATEVAALLAYKGRYRESPTGPIEPLRVALIDFDLASANVSARLGLAQPTILDYLCDTSLQTPDPRDFVVRHAATNLDVLLGPSKCLAGDRAELMGVAQAARILSSLKNGGYQFLIVDMSASLGDLETYILEAASRIYCVVTPTAGSIQSLYRGVEALRRLGLGPKLQYVGNKMREGVKLSEAMSDLQGSLAASIPYDPLFDSAENRHQPLCLEQGSDTSGALLQLASSIYPALEVPLRARSGFSPLAWLGRRRRAG